MLHSFVYFPVSPFSGIRSRLLGGAYTALLILRIRNEGLRLQAIKVLEINSRPVVAKKLCFEHAHSVHFRALIPFTIPRRLKEISKFLPIHIFVL